MWYQFRRVWPVLRTLIVCGTICYVATLAFLYNRGERAKRDIGNSPMWTAQQLERLGRVERALQMILAEYPMESIRKAIWTEAEFQFIPVKPDLEPDGEKTGTSTSSGPSASERPAEKDHLTPEP